MLRANCTKFPEVQHSDFKPENFVPQEGAESGFNLGLCLPDWWSRVQVVLERATIGDCWVQQEPHIYQLHGQMHLPGSEAGAEDRYPLCGDYF